MSKKYPDPDNKFSYDKESNFSEDQYTHSDAPIPIEDKYTKPEKRRHSFGELVKKYKKAKNVGKNKR